MGNFFWEFRESILTEISNKDVVVLPEFRRELGNALYGIHQPTNLLCS